MSEWKPIEAAPKDGTPVLLWDDIYETGWVASWEEPGVWCDVFGNLLNGVAHWMPLPAPPPPLEESKS